MHTEIHEFVLASLLLKKKKKKNLLSVIEEELSHLAQRWSPFFPTCFVHTCAVF